jgi:hypothetical protein
VAVPAVDVPTCRDGLACTSCTPVEGIPARRVSIANTDSDIRTINFREPGSIFDTPLAVRRVVCVVYRVPHTCIFHHLEKSEHDCETRRVSLG